MRAFRSYVYFLQKFEIWMYDDSSVYSWRFIPRKKIGGYGLLTASASVSVGLVDPGHMFNLRGHSFSIEERH